MGVAKYCTLDAEDALFSTAEYLPGPFGTVW